jgi:hypothetical protein
VRNIYEMLRAVAAIAVFGAIVVTGAAQQAFGQAAQSQKKVKDQGEYDLFNAVNKDTDPAKKIQDLNAWADKYPDSDYKNDRLLLFMQAYSQAKPPQPDKVVQVGGQLMANDVKTIFADNPQQILTTYLLPSMSITGIPNPTQEQLATGEKAAHELLGYTDTFFAASKKPATTSDADWTKARAQVEGIGKAALVWIATRPAVQAYEKKDYPAAEAAFTKAVQQYPDNGQAVYYLGLSIYNQRNPDTFPKGLFFIARAVTAGTGLDDAAKKTMDTFLTKAYTTYHGSADGLDQLKQQASASATPPAGFTVASAAEVAAKKEQEFAASNPQLAQWLAIKKELAGPNGEQYFDSSVKGAGVPKFKGTVVAANPAVRSKELVLALSDSTNPEVTLKLETPLTGKPEIGQTVEFEGVPSAFTKEPFNLTMDIENDKITGLKVDKVAPAPARKGVTKKKAE